MSAITILLYVMIFIISLLLIALILIQPSKSGGMGAAFGGVGESAFGGKAGSHLTKTTVVMTTIFFVFALLLAAFIGRGIGETKKGFRDALTEKANDDNKSGDADKKESGNAVSSAESANQKGGEKAVGTDAPKGGEKAIGTDAPKGGKKSTK